MSILTDKLRAVIFSNLREDVPRNIRQAAWNLFTAIDSDLDVAGYIPSSTTDESAEKFDETLAKGEIGVDDIYEIFGEDDVDYGDDVVEEDNKLKLFDGLDDDIS